MKKTLLVALALPLLLLAATPASADSTPQQKAEAQVLFDQGRDLVEQGRFAEACPKLAESQKLDPGLGTLLWLADCLESRGQTASAWATFSEAASIAAASGDRRQSVAQARAQKLSPKLSRLVLVVPADRATRGVKVLRDGAEVGPAEWGMPVPVDPGSHTVTASAPGLEAWSTQVEVTEDGQTLEIAVPELHGAGATEAPATDADVTAAPDAAPRATLATSPQSRGTGATQRWVGLGVGGAGAVMLGLGATYGVLAKVTYDGTGSHCQGNACDAAGRQQRGSALDQATISTVMFGLGAAAAAGGAALYFLAPSGPVTVGVTPRGQGAEAWVSGAF